MEAFLERTKPHQPFIQLLASAKTHQRRALLKSARTSQLKYLSDLANNVLRGNLPINLEEKLAFQKRKASLKRVGWNRRGDNPAIRRRQYLRQKGSGIASDLSKFALRHLECQPKPPMSSQRTC